MVKGINSPETEREASVRKIAVYGTSLHGRLQCAYDSLEAATHGNVAEKLDQWPRQV